MPSPPSIGLLADVPVTAPNAKAGERPPVMPLAATEHAAAGARAFAEFFVRTMDWGYATTSASYLRHNYETSCVACRSIADAIERAARARHRFIGDRFAIRSTGQPVPTADSVRIAVRFDVSSAEVVDRRGEYVAALPAMRDVTETVRISWINSRWAVTGMTPAQPQDGVDCAIDSDGGLLGGAHGVVVDGVCVPVHGTTDGNGTRRGPPTKTIACGSLVPDGTWNRQCGPKIMECYDVEPGRGNAALSAFARVTEVDGTWTGPVVWCPADLQPAFAMAALRQQAVRLLPYVPIGSAWADTARVNDEVIFWADTRRDRSLGTVRIAGRRVAMRISIDHADWNFGDGDTDTTTDPGKPYDNVGDPCRTAQCPHYYGHTYARIGAMAITVTISWHAQFRLAGGAWSDLGPSVTGPTDLHLITVE